MSLNGRLNRLEGGNKERLIVFVINSFGGEAGGKSINLAWVHGRKVERAPSETVEQFVDRVEAGNIPAPGNQEKES